MMHVLQLLSLLLLLLPTCTSFIFTSFSFKSVETKVKLSAGFGSKATVTSNQAPTKHKDKKEAGRKVVEDLPRSRSGATAVSSTTTNSRRPGFEPRTSQSQSGGVAPGSPQSPPSQKPSTPPKRKPAILRSISKASPTLLDNHLDTIDLAYPGIKLAHENPPVFVVEKFFTPEECDRYIALAEEGLTVESKTFTSFTSNHRQSTTWFMEFKKVPELLVKVEKLTGVKLSHFEEPQIVRYQMGDRFLWHSDAVPDSQLRADLSDGGQRVATLLVYLNDVPQGGATAFQDLGIAVKPVKGNALLFFPSRKRKPEEKAKGSYVNDEVTVHAGEHALDTKWIAQMWVHEAPYPPAIPPGNNHIDAVAGMEAYKQVHQP